MRGKRTFTLLACIYWPAVYFGIYLPFIVPILGRWKQIPVWIPIITGLGFIFVLVSMGIRNSQKTNFFHAIGIQVSLLLFLFSMTMLNMPAFKKGDYGAIGGRFLEDLIVLLAPIMIMFAVAEGGRILLTKKARS